MAYCPPTAAINGADCKTYNGGIKKIWILGTTASNFAVSGVTAGVGSITSLTGTGVFYPYTLPKDSAIFNETIQTSAQSSSVSYTQELVVKLHGLQSAIRAQLQILATNRNLKIVFQDANDGYWLIGMDRGAEITAETDTTGTAIADENSYTVTFTAIERYKVVPFTSTLAASITASPLTIAADAV